MTDDGEGRMVLWPEDRSEGYPFIIIKSDGGLTFLMFSDCISDSQIICRLHV